MHENQTQHLTFKQMSVGRWLFGRRQSHFAICYSEDQQMADCVRHIVISYHSQCSGKKSRVTRPASLFCPWNALNGELILTYSWNSEV